MTDTTKHTVLNTPQPATPPGTAGAIVSGSRWAWIPAVLGLVALLGICAAALIPATVVAEKENRRTTEVEEAPYAQVPASAESVNDRVLFGSDLPDDIPRFAPSGDFFFVTVSAPEQSLLSWFAGRGDPAIDLLTEEDKYGVRTASQRRAAALQQMRTEMQKQPQWSLAPLCPLCIAGLGQGQPGAVRQRH